MIITHKIALRLDCRDEQQIIDAVQGDSARAVEISLLERDAAWTVPEGATAMIRYRRFPGDAGGLYDTLPDGTAAYTISADKLTVFLAPQALAAAGMTELQVTLIKDEAELTCFSILIRVQGNLSDTTMDEEDYVNLTEHIRTEVDAAVAEIDHIVVKEGAVDLYVSLADALTDVNSGTVDHAITEAADAKVKVFTAHNGRLTVMLVDDVTESDVMSVGKNVDLVLAGHTLVLTGGARIDFAEGISGAIYGGVDPATGKRGSIVKTEMTDSNMVIVQCLAREVFCKGVDFSAAGETAGSLYGIYSKTTNVVTKLEDCSVYVENTGASAASVYALRAMNPDGELVLENCELLVKAVAGDAFGVYNSGSITLVKTAAEVSTQTGAHAVVLNNVGVCTTHITGSDLKATAETGGVSYIVYGTQGGTIQLSHSNGEVRTVTGGDATALYIPEDGIANVEHSHIKAVVQMDEKCQCAIAAENYGILRAKDSTFHADAKGGSTSQDMSIGIFNSGTAYLDDCTVTGTHSGCQNSAMMYVSGGVYTGTVHGGFYFAHGPEGIGYVTDANIRDGHYDGEFTDYWNAQEWVYWGGFYVGGGSEDSSSNMTVYLDGCTMEGVKHSFTMRGSSGETNNTVCLSNCTLVDGVNKPINFHNDTHRVIVGAGCNITTDMIWMSNGAEAVLEMMVFTDELYRKAGPEKTLNGRDYHALAGAAGGKTVVVEDSVPEYVRTEAERVAALVQSRQNANTVTMMLGSDIHARLGLASGSYLTSQMLASTQHAAQAMKIIRDRVHIDFAGLLGDYLWDNGETADQAMEMYRIIAEYFSPAFSGLPRFWVKGNHDMLGNSTSGMVLTDEQTFSGIGIHNTGAVFQSDNRVQGYCYRDFDEYQLRVVCMNTCETYNSHAVSDAQNAWLAQALSLTGKSGWRSIILCHVPLDSWGAESTVLKNVAAYADTILCVIHGHLHNYLTGTLTGTTIPRICIPNIDFYRTNEYGENDTGEGTGGYIEYGEETSYEKTADTAEDTAFCVVTIDLEAGKLYADHYGAGYDRVVDLNTGSMEDGESDDIAGEYTNQIPLSTATIGGTEVYNGVGYKAGTRLDSSFAEEDAAGMCCTGYIPVEVGDVIRIKNVTIYGSNDAYGCVYTAVGGGAVSFSGAEMTAATTDGVTTLTVTGETTDQLYFRISVGVIDDTSIITVNEEIA